MRNRISLVAWLLSSCFLIFWNHTYQYTLSSNQKATRLWEISGYYMYLPSILMKDIKTLSFQSKIIDEYQFSTHTSKTFQHKKSGNQVIQYPAGMAIAYAPFFIIGHLVAILGDYPKDGFSIPYQLAIYWGSVLVAIMGLWFCRSNLLKYFDDKVTALTLIVILFGTNYFTYATIYPELPYNYLFMLYSILIAAAIEWHKQPTFRIGLVIGACMGLVSLVWISEIVGLLIPIIWGIGYSKDIMPKLQRFIFHFRKVLVAALVGLVIGGLQLVYWKYVTGKFVINYYVENTITWWDKHPKQMMTTYLWVWITENPILIFVWIGFFFLWRQQRSIFWVTLLYSVGQLWINSFWNIWGNEYYANQSTMIHAYPILLFPLASFLSFACSKWWSAVLTSLLILAMILRNFIL